MFSDDLMSLDSNSDLSDAGGTRHPFRLSLSLSRSHRSMRLGTGFTNTSTRTSASLPVIELQTYRKPRALRKNKLQNALLFLNAKKTHSQRTIYTQITRRKIINFKSDNYFIHLPMDSYKIKLVRLEEGVYYGNRWDEYAHFL